MANHVRTRWLVGCGATLAILSALGACSSSSRDFDNGNGGSSGSGGAGSGGTNPGQGESGEASTGKGGSGAGSANEGGSGGEAVVPMLPCVTAAECDDGKACNGEEACVDNLCQAGESPCPNDDPDHCAITCEEAAAGPTCGLEGRDADDDGHADQACAQNPGDDCDDSATGANVYPGAPETCNGDVDDDCDGDDESTDEVALAGESKVLSAAVGTTVRDKVAIAGVPGGGFGVVWTDRRGGVQNIFYRALEANGAPGNELQLTSDTAFINNDDPDIVVLASDTSEFFVIHTAEEFADGDFVLRSVEVKFGGLVKENESPVAGGNSLSKLSPSNIYRGLSRMSFCNPTGACNAWFGNPDAFYAADDFHVSPLSDRLVWENDGNLAMRDPTTTPVAVQETTAENRTAARITENGSSTLLAYRYDNAGIRVGQCEFPDGIPVDLTTTGSESVLLYWNPARTALYVRSVTTDCAFSPSALVVEKGNTNIGSAALAVDGNGALAVVWSSEDTDTGGWSIMSRVFGATLCE